MTLGRKKPLCVVKINASIIILSHLGMNRFVCKVDEERFVMLLPNEFNCITTQDVSCIARSLDQLAVFVDFRIDIGTLSFKTHPTIEARPRSVVIAHMPLADERGLIP